MMQTIKHSFAETEWVSITRRKLLLVTAGAIGVPAIAFAQTYPERPIRLLVGVAAGGGADVVARIMAEALSQRLGQQFIVENRTGMGGNLSTQTLVNSAPDGYTLLFTGSNSTISASLYKRLPFDFRRDTTPVAFILRIPNLMVVSPSLPINSVAEFIDYAKRHPGKLSFASSGVGTGVHLSGEMFKAMTGISMIHVPYRGAAAAYPDLIEGRVHVLFDNITSALKMAQSGKVRALGVTSASRWGSLSDIPAVAETVPGYEAIIWYGIVAPRGTPPDIVLTSNGAIKAIFGDAALRARLEELGGQTISMSPGELGKFIDEDTERWRRVIKFAGISVD
jgi:tripartite-type tricarboxylate transporter receptor subunit TctC